MEEYKDIEGYNGKYQISNLGRVVKINEDNTRESLTFHLNGDVLQVSLDNKFVSVDKLVIKAFIPKKFKLEVKHLNGLVIDCRVDNLDYEIVAVEEETTGDDESVVSETESVGEHQPYRGVYFNNTTKKWVPNIHIYNRCIYAGNYTRQEDAVKVRQELEKIKSNYNNVSNVHKVSTNSWLVKLDYNKVPYRINCKTKEEAVGELIKLKYKLGLISS